MNIKKIARRIRKTIFRSSINNSKLYEKEFIKHSNSSSGLGSSFVKYKAHNLTSQEVSRVKHIALYLTQFHTNKENDQWWGKNFTEWVNATKATPQYEGHHQPHLPHDVGFYNLLEKSTWSQQIDLAKNYGIYGFCFYYYWFNGKRLLDGPLNLFLKDKELDFPFCLFWANDSWTRTWHGFSDNKGSEREVLMEQSHNDLDDELFITHLLDHYFSDKRYIRVNDKPLLIVYHTYLFKNISKTTEKWRSIAKRRGTDLFLMYVLMPGQEDAPLIDGFDAAMQFSPIGTKQENCHIHVLNPNFEGKTLSYETVVESEETRTFNFPVARGCFATWDNEGRRPTKGTSYPDANPTLFGRYLSAMNEYSLKNPIENESIVFLNAWNEWAEGAHLEPDRKYGYTWLQAVTDVIKEQYKTRRQNEF